MTFVALVGDCTTTTTLALASSSPAERDVLVVEADRRGGSIAAWMGEPVAPSISTAVAGLRHSAGDAAAIWSHVESVVRRSRHGIRFLPAPVRSVEATQAIDEAERTLFPSIARHTTALVDVGSRAAADGVPPSMRMADRVIVCHRQATASAGAAAVRVERTAELVEAVDAGSDATDVVVAVIGDDPFEPTELADYFVAAAPDATVTVAVLAIDELAAAVLAGRRGLSDRRFARLPLIRSCAHLAESIAP